MTTAMDSRTRQYLIDVGGITRRGLTRKPQHRQCPIGCGQVLLAAQDMGHELWCDRHPLTALGELAAVLAGRATYTHAAGAFSGRIRIGHRRRTSRGDYGIATPAQGAARSVSRLVAKPRCLPAIVIAAFN